ncbi:Lovastatin hydrolase [Hyphodiscus hymeniophilus]|uniref:Lovastatin hydrolase n=1 Tax=Hyphodiscus hymeniophilus TaxID=353542 RepID=A0A9P6SMP8_9HELO|nr:Lovastatin hydrolase [Hyphodiscus hymeniophilus]
MATLEEQFQQACDARDLPGVVLLASDIKGNFTYEKAFGLKNPIDKIGVDATFIMASCTKLMTSISALQCVERGQIGLDDDLSTVLSEFKDIQILTGFKEGTVDPIHKKAVNKITLRQLLTHSSGLGYDTMNPLLIKWRESRGKEAGQKGDPILKRITIPLLFEPGTSWEYGYGIDWAGVLVMRLNKMSLEAYMQKYLWDPLSIRNITFHQELKLEVRKNLVKMSTRGKQGMRGLATPTEEKVEWTDELLYEDPWVDEFGGAGGIGSGVEYMKILHSICADDGKLLMSETIDEMFTPQLGDDARRALAVGSVFLDENGMFSSHEPGTERDYGLGGALILSDKRTGLRAGTLSWSGLPNLLWTIDRESGICLMYASNLVPFGDQKSHEMQQLFEREMYARSSKL